MSILENILKQDSTLTQKVTAEEFEKLTPICTEISDEVEAYKTYKRVIDELSR